MDEFIPHHARVTAEGAEPSRWMFVLHGIFGSGGNFRSFARRVAQAHPSWGMMLVDLRGHGMSQDPPPPYTLDAAAEDLVRLEALLGWKASGILGHSLGAKVALAYLAKRSEPVEHAFILDVDPGPRTRTDRPSNTRRVLKLLRSMPKAIPSRESFLERVQGEGFGRSMAEWLAMNVRRTSDGLALRLDLDVMEALLDDHHARDLTFVLEDERSARGLHLIVGGQSQVVSEEVREKLLGLRERAPWLTVDVLERAGHWVHVEEPDGLFEVISRELGSI